MTDLLTALGLALTIEGALYALFPGGMKRMMRQVLERPDGNLRAAGIAAAVAGVVLVWLLRAQ